MPMVPPPPNLMLELVKGIISVRNAETQIYKAKRIGILNKIISFILFL